MKRKFLISLVALFVLSACQSNKQNSNGSKPTFSITSDAPVSTTSEGPSSVAPTSASQPIGSSSTYNPTSSGSKSTGSSSNSMSSVTPSSSSSSSTTSASITPTPPVEFSFSKTELTIDINSTYTASLSVFNPVSSTEKISWSVPHSNIIRLEKTETVSEETNTINAITVGSVRLKGEANGKTAFCDINVINSKEKPTSGTQNIAIYAINDYHGAVTNEFSIKHLGTLIKQKVSQKNTLFLDQGDTFQGTLQSNYNYGRMITDVYNASGMSARTVGNHDFDWGGARLEANTNANYHGYSTPVLAANVYDYDFSTKTMGNEQQSEIGQEYTTFTLESGIKVGVIGLIGEECITSINSQFVEEYGFKNSAQITKTISDKLRTEENCDVVIASIHDRYNSDYASQVTSESPVSNKKYVDLVLNGHTHKWELETYNNVTFAQFGENGKTIGKINLTYDFATGLVSNTAVYNLSSSSLLSDVPVLDQEIVDIVDYYEDQVNDIKDEVLTTQLSGGFDEYETLPNYVSKAMYHASISQGYDVSYAIVNNAREPLYGPTVTYETLFHSLPFDNVIYIIKVLGSEIRNELGWSSNSFYRGNNANALSALDDSKIYTIACIDYLAFHCNSYRDYNYFPSVTSMGYLTKNDQYYTYREITADYMRNTSGTISSSSYRDSLDHFNPYRLSESITNE